MTDEHVFGMVANTCSQSTLIRAVALAAIALVVWSVARTALGRPRPEGRLPREGLRHALVDRAARTTAATFATRSGRSSSEPPRRRRDLRPGRRSSCRSSSLRLLSGAPRLRSRRWISTSSSSARPRSAPTARRGTELAARAARRRPAALRLRRGHAAPAAALVGRARRSRGDLHHALPRRPLPRAARDAEDVLAPDAGRAAHASTDRPGCATSSTRSRASSARLTYPRRARRGARRATCSRATATRSASSRSTTACPRSGTRSSRTSGPAASTTRRPTRSASRSAPSGARSSAARPSTLADGRIVQPERARRRAAARPDGRLHRRHPPGGGRRDALPRRRPADPRGDLRRGRARARRRHRALDRASRPPRSHATPACRCSRSRTSRRATSARELAARGARGLPRHDPAARLRRRRAPVPASGASRRSSRAAPGPERHARGDARPRDGRRGFDGRAARYEELRPGRRRTGGRSSTRSCGSASSAASRVLEIGCGTGRLAQALEERERSRASGRSTPRRRWSRARRRSA